MPEMTGGEALVQALIGEGVETLYGLPGVQLDGLYNALHDAGGRIRVVSTRHEQGAGYMALGRALATGGISAYAVVPGPGLLNTFSALATAWSSNARVLCLSGQIPSALIGKDWGLLHEVPDQLGMLRHLTSWADRIEHPRDVPAKVAEAFRRLRSGRPRPVGLEMAMDRMLASEEVQPRRPLVPEPPTAPDPERIRNAARWLGRAKRPLILVGGGIFGAEEELQALAEMLQAPVSAHWMGRGALSDDHPLAVTDPLGRRLFPEADVVLAVGTRLYHQRTMWTRPKGQRILNLNIDPAELRRIGMPDAIEADAKLGLRALLAELPKHNQKRASRTDELRALKAEMDRMYESRLGPQVAYLRAIRGALDADGVFVEDLTQVGYVSRFAMPVYRPRTYFTSGYQGTLGWGFATAIGIKDALPDRQVVTVTGDGGFLYTASELATAVRYRIPVVAVVFNDGAYGNVKRMQAEQYGGRVIGTDLANPDFVRFAESFGAAGFRAETPEALGRVLKEAFRLDGPAIIEVPMGDVPDPWEILLGQDLDSALRAQRKK